MGCSVSEHSWDKYVTVKRTVKQANQSDVLKYKKSVYHSSHNHLSVHCSNFEIQLV